MNIYHFIPSCEQGKHQIDVDCPCNPERIPDSMIENLEDLSGEVCYEHNLFSGSKKAHLLDHVILSETPEISPE
jgi:hypothetical protein